MIDKRELRIGSLVAHYNLIYKVECIWYNEVRIKSDKLEAVCGFDNIEPIPITPEWLERAGFVGYLSSSGDTIYTFSRWLTLEPQDPDIGTWCLRQDHQVGNDFKYIHQLQNLYFALTGEELEINPFKK